MKKILSSGALFGLLAIALVWGAPLRSEADPVSVVVVAVGSVFGYDYLSCGLNLVWGCDEGGGGGGGGGGSVQTPCTSPANSCGMTNTGFVVREGAGYQGGTCNATPPPDSSCPQPTVGANQYYSARTTLGPNMSTTLYWTAQNATSCRITSDAGFNHTGGTSGNVSTGAITQTTTFTLTCSGASGSVSKSLRILYDPSFREI